MKRPYKIAFHTPSLVRQHLPTIINGLCIELLLFIFSFCSPATLHRCRRVCTLWQNLIKKETIWVKSHQVYLPRLPLPPADVISQSQFLELLLGRGCQLCGRPRIRKVAWKWLVRACAPCLHAHSKSLFELVHVRGFEYAGPDRCLLFEEGEFPANKRVYWWPTIETRQTRWHHVDENQTSWLEAQRAVFERGNEFISKLRPILYLQSLQAREDRQMAILRRKEDILERAQELTPSMSVEMVELSDSFERFARMKKPLDQCWPECAKLLLQEREQLVDFLCAHNALDESFEKLFEEMDEMEFMRHDALVRNQKRILLQNDIDELLESLL